jgi:1-acyl-sn-glycerol-3-phosphate acyltransferase
MSRAWFQRFANKVLRFLLVVFLDYEVDGLESIPPEGPLITAQNHMIFVDTVIGAVFITREIVGVSKAENYYNPFFAFFFKLYGTLPIRRGEVDRTALRASLKVLEEGKVLMAAPEGTRSKTNTLQEGKDGLAYLAVKAGAPVLPIAIWGQEKFWQQLRRLRRTKVKMVMGEPFIFRTGEGKLTREQLTQMTDEMMYRLAGLLPPEYRGYYSDLSAATEEYVRPYDGRLPKKMYRDGKRSRSIFSKGGVKS